MHLSPSNASPLLFNIFLADLPKHLDNPEDRPLSLNNDVKLSCIIWADDLLLLSETESGLNNILSELNQYSTKNLLEINSSTGEVSFKSAPDYEIATDIDTDNTVIFTVIVDFVFKL